MLIFLSGLCPAQITLWHNTIMWSVDKRVLMPHTEPHRAECFGTGSCLDEKCCCTHVCGWKVSDLLDVRFQLGSLCSCSGRFTNPRCGYSTSWEWDSTLTSSRKSFQIFSLMLMFVGNLSTNESKTQTETLFKWCKAVQTSSSLLTVPNTWWFIMHGGLDSFVEDE